MTMPYPSELDDPDASHGWAADLTRSMAEIEAGSYQGADPARLVTVTVDGRGVVLDVRLIRTIGQHSPAAVSAAICAAVDAARRRLDVAFAAVTARAGITVDVQPEGRRARPPIEGFGDDDGE
jgi:hypothetical protein